MAFDATNEGIQALQQLVEKILNGGPEGQQAALDYSRDPEGLLAEQGISDADLSDLDMRQLVAECAEGADLPPSTQQALQSYSSGGGSSYPVSTPPAASHSASEVVQHLNYVTYATYEDNDEITQQLINYEDNSTNIDNSVDVEVDGDVDGDLEIDLDTTNVNATGDGAVAAGEDAEGVATGDGAVAAGDDVENAATGDGSQVIDGDNFGLANTGDEAILAGDDIGAANSGTFTGVQAGEDVENAVVGDDNQTVQGEVEADVINFGGGSDINNFDNADFDDSAVSVGGDATNVSDNELEEGAAISGTGDAEGNFEDTFVDADESIVTTEQGPGDLEQENEEFEEVAGG
jgi:hypothetical protein